MNYVLGITEGKAHSYQAKSNGDATSVTNKFNQIEHSKRKDHSLAHSLSLSVNEAYSCKWDFNDRCFIDEDLIHGHLLPIYCEFICVQSNYLHRVIERDLIWCAEGLMLLVELLPSAWWWPNLEWRETLTFWGGSPQASTRKFVRNKFSPFKTILIEAMN